MSTLLKLKDQLCNDMESEWGLQNPGKVVLGLEDFIGYVGRAIDGLEGVHGGHGIGKRNVDGRRLLEFCDEKELCVANTWFEKKKQRKIIFSMGGNEIKIDFVLVGKSNKNYLKDVKAIPCDLQHRLLVTDIAKRKLQKVVKKKQTVRKKFQENIIKFLERVKELVNVEAPNL